MARRKNQQPSWWIAFALLVMGTMTLLNKLQLPSVETVEQPASQSPPTAGTAKPLPPAASSDTLRIASFNIQVFGQSKMSNAVVIERLAEIVRQFDLVAIQEIRAQDQAVLPNFVNIVNARGGDYQFLISPRLGRTSSMEQYAYVYRGSRLEVIPGSVFNVDDPKDLLHREPFVASFRARGAKGIPFSFTLINAHTDPDEAEWEVGQLAQVYQFVANFHRNEDDIILLGDLNVDHQKLSAFTRIPMVASIVPAGPTNTRGTKQYDHILIDRLDTTEFTGNAGVFNMEQFFQISQEEALLLSDHQPVWAEFRTIESRDPTRMASPENPSIVR
ncbi:MAG: endonuclease/exonuclease/phosphatase family protein [Planctomycetaceae bacterium]|nr:endonuclease/exonuclease/phosphatase family protein [Planctomycetaceae bacterium]